MSYVLQLYTMELASLLERVSKYAESSTPPNTQKQNEWVKKLYNIEHDDLYFQNVKHFKFLL